MAMESSDTLRTGFCKIADEIQGRLVEVDAT